jgi:holo-[acyl-carrier protein] synthase
VRLRLPGQGWAFRDDSARERFHERLALLLKEKAPPPEDELRALVAEFQDADFLDRPGVHFHPRIEMRFLPEESGPRGDRDVDLQIHLGGWDFRDADAKREFDRALNLLSSPSLPDAGSLIDQAFLDTVRDEIESLILGFASEGRIAPKGRTEFEFLLPAPPAGRVAGVGIDAVEVPRMARALTRHPGLSGVFLTPSERHWAAGRADRVALAFAAKEAAFKAFGESWTRGRLGWTDIEVQPDAGGYSLNLLGAAEALAASRAVDRIEAEFDLTEERARVVVILLRR